MNFLVCVLAVVSIVEIVVIHAIRAAMTWDFFEWLLCSDFIQILFTKRRKIRHERDNIGHICTHISNTIYFGGNKECHCIVLIVSIPMVPKLLLLTKDSNLCDIPWFKISTKGEKNDFRLIHFFPTIHVMYVNHAMWLPLTTNVFIKKWS